MLPILVTKTSWVENLLQLLFSVGIFILVLFLAYLAARIAGAYQSGVVNRNSNIRIIETYRVANNKFIQVAEIGGKYVALGICKDNISFLCELDGDNILEMPTKPLEKPDFKSILSKVRKDSNAKDTHSQDNE